MLSIRTVLLRGDHAYVVQGLEHDIAAQGPTPEAAMLAFHQTLELETRWDLQRGVAPLSSVPPAPAEFFRLWKEPAP